MISELKYNKVRHNFGKTKPFFGGGGGGLQQKTKVYHCANENLVS